MVPIPTSRSNNYDNFLEKEKKLQDLKNHKVIIPFISIVT